MARESIRSIRGIGLGSTLHDTPAPRTNRNRVLRGHAGLLRTVMSRAIGLGDDTTLLRQWLFARRRVRGRERIPPALCAKLRRSGEGRAHITKLAELFLLDEREGTIQ